MVQNLENFLKEYQIFVNVILEYASAHQAIKTTFANREQVDIRNIIVQLDWLESDYARQNHVLELRLQEQFDRLNGLLQVIEQQERGIHARKYQKIKRNETPVIADSVRNEIGSRHYTQAELSRQVDETINSIRKITGSRMPDSIVALCSFFNPRFRRKHYRQIIENKERLKQMIETAKRDSHLAFQGLQSDISANVVNQAGQLAIQKSQNDSIRGQQESQYLRQLTVLLLDGLEQVLISGEVYQNLKQDLNSYLYCYTGFSSEIMPPEKITFGILRQNTTIQDNGILDTCLNRIFGNPVYANHELLVPVAVQKDFTKPICVTYFSQFNAGVYDIFQNYALQMLNLYYDTGISIYLADCTNMGGKYADFTSFESHDENKRINIIRTLDELKNILNEMSEYIIETNISYLKNIFPNVTEYNRNSVIKREIKAIFISNLSELASSELLSKMMSIVRNGNRCGVYPFIAVSTDEMQVSGIVAQERVSMINDMMHLCDRIGIDSNNRLNLGSRTFCFSPPPAVDHSKAQFLMQRAVTAQRQAALVLLSDHLISQQQFFTFQCRKNIRIPVGIDAQGNEFVLDFHRDAAYMLVGGDPAGGKSSLMHTIILQAITRYSPEQLQLYLADLKDGVEFESYLKTGVRSVNAVLNDASDADMISSFFRYIQALVETRNTAFEELAAISGRNVRNIEEFYEINDREHLVPDMPRILLIIDEFQSVYDTSREAGELTNFLVRMCRTVGISIIMASQRAQADATRGNSFTSDIKDYFIYRVLFKCPFSSARQFVSEQCSDTGHDNTAVRKAQTLKKGQAIINTNMGATEEHNYLIQCYYPDSNCIDTVCNVITTMQGNKEIVELDSELPAHFNPEDFFHMPGYCLGISNQFHYDFYEKNTDPVHDDTFISIMPESNLKILCTGTDEKVRNSTFWVLLVKLLSDYQKRLYVNILIALEDQSRLAGFELLSSSGVHISRSVSEFLDYGQNVPDNGFLYQVIYQPTSFSELHRQDWDTSANDTIDAVIKQFNRPNSLQLLLALDAKQLRDRCSYLYQTFCIRIISVGNIDAIRSAVAGERQQTITECGFHVIRPGVTKAYYYNQATDKIGKFRMFDTQTLLEAADFSVLNRNETEEDTGGYAGLFGN